MGVILGLMRTNDYETIVQSLSLVSSLLKVPDLPKEQILSGRLLQQILKSLKGTRELEFIVHFAQIVNLTLGIKSLRSIFLENEICSVLA